jgi:hypothetical protein
VPRPRLRDQKLEVVDLVSLVADDVLEVHDASLGEREIIPQRLAIGAAGRGRAHPRRPLPATITPNL